MLQDFKRSLDNSSPPKDLTPALLALWHDGRGDWGAAHRVAQDVEDETAAWVHAYLHGTEGDEANAGYWYRRARRPHSRLSLEAEWEEIAATLCE